MKASIEVMEAKLFQEIKEKEVPAPGPSEQVDVDVPVPDLPMESIHIHNTQNHIQSQKERTKEQDSLLDLNFINQPNLGQLEDKPLATRIDPVTSDPFEDLEAQSSSKKEFIDDEDNALFIGLEKDIQGAPSDWNQTVPSSLNQGSLLESVDEFLSDIFSSNSSITATASQSNPVPQKHSENPMLRLKDESPSALDAPEKSYHPNNSETTPPVAHEANECPSQAVDKSLPQSPATKPKKSLAMNIQVCSKLFLFLSSSLQTK